MSLTFKQLLILKLKCQNSEVFSQRYLPQTYAKNIREKEFENYEHPPEQTKHKYEKKIGGINIRGFQKSTTTFRFASRFSGILKKKRYKVLERSRQSLSFFSISYRQQFFPLFFYTYLYELYAYLSLCAFLLVLSLCCYLQ